MSITDLKHTTRKLGGEGEIVVINTGAEITPEASAMIAALHSRSVGGVHHHLDVLAKKGADKFMETFYVGYGHKSIGDNGNACVFVEGISMLAAKAIQDWRLYNGQEASTRYIDFAHQKFLNPVNTPAGEEILETWRTFYLKGLEELFETLKERFPKAPDEDEKAYTKAIKARAFDIMRAFLPAGATTNVAWYMNLRQFTDELLGLRHHPLAEVRDIAIQTEQALITAFPSSFSDKRYEKTEAYIADMSQQFTYFSDPDPVDFELTHNNINRKILSEYRSALETRPAKTELPKEIAECGTLTFRFLLDFGSFRDIQRHRAVVQRMPRLTTTYGFTQWYLDELSPSLRTEATQLIESQTQSIKKLGLSPDVEQYYIAMGFQTTNRLTGDLRALTYLAELRATRFVHPTLRLRAKQIAETLEKEFKHDGLILHLDQDPDRFDIKRGTHDIEIKE